jgi:hypothetical protein
MTISRDDERLTTLEKKTARLSFVCWLQLAVVCGLCFCTVPAGEGEGGGWFARAASTGADH